MTETVSTAERISEAQLDDQSAAIRDTGTFVTAVRTEIGKRLVGQEMLVDRVLISLLTGGHILLEGVPGLAKTLTVRTLAEAIHTTFHRIQYTPDLLPADVVGTLVYNEKTGDFEPKKGPIFANLVLADEINRAPAKVQSALLEAMQEHQVTIGEETHMLPDPFIVLATQNPIEHEGTYPLPEAQLDRFMMRVAMGYPERAKELEMLQTHGTGSIYDELKPVVHAEDIIKMTVVARSVHFADVLRGYLIDLAEATREHPDVLLGASPRAGLFLQRAARAVAAAEGRDYASPDDVKTILSPVLNHRLIVRPEAQMRGTTVSEVLEQVVGTVPVPGTVPTG